MTPVDAASGVNGDVLDHTWVSAQTARAVGGASRRCVHPKGPRPHAQRQST